MLMRHRTPTPDPLMQRFLLILTTILLTVCVTQPLWAHHVSANDPAEVEAAALIVESAPCCGEVDHSTAMGLDLTSVIVSSLSNSLAVPTPGRLLQASAFARHAAQRLYLTHQQLQLHF